MPRKTKQYKQKRAKKNKTLKNTRRGLTVDAVGIFKNRKQQSLFQIPTLKSIIPMPMAMPKKSTASYVKINSVTKIGGPKSNAGLTKLYLIHSKGCGHCISMMGEWEKLKGKVASGNASGLTITDIEASSDEFKNIKQDLGITIEGFPTIVKKKNGKTEYYSGARTADEIYKWATA